MKHLRNIFQGMASVLESIATTRPYVRVSGGFKQDAQNLTRDAQTFAADFTKQAELANGPYATATRKNRSR